MKNAQVVYLCIILLYECKPCVSKFQSLKFDFQHPLMFNFDGKFRKYTTTIFTDLLVLSIYKDGNNEMQ